MLSRQSNSENLSPDVVKRISKEVRELVESPIEGIKLIVDDSDLTDIQAVITGPADTPYSGGQFRIKLILSKEFPQSPPRAFFVTKVFHPNVATPSGEICVNTLKRDWKAELGVKHILLTIKCLLIDPNPESALNEEAGRLLMEDYASYASRARMVSEVHAGAPSSSSSASTSSGAINPNQTMTADTCGGKRPDPSKNSAEQPLEKKSKPSPRKLLRRL